MRLSGTTLVNAFICGLLVANACLSVCVARSSSVVRSYRDEVAKVAVDVYNYVSTTEARFSNIESNVVSSASILHTDSDVASADYQKTIGRLPYRYSVVRGRPGISMGHNVYYSIGQLTAYGVITAVGPDFVEFDGSRRYVLGSDTDHETRIIGG